MHGKEYLVHVEAKSYEEAVSYCATKGGKLAEPKSDEANNDIVNLAESNIMEFINVWIGIDDKSQEGYFVYASDGSPIVYSNWMSDQPNNWNNQDCVHYAKLGSDVRWGDERCSMLMSFICERSQGKQIDINHFVFITAIE